ncbi:ABC transporter G family member 34-like [Benincasa hispida]|uniref:ABC transporter G family member 34-like n=1 Tax=Benincasa hispida TaxID=102211 RepID=UPI0018FF4CA2|nr:ABC transporter G family member 34-like [Benincasa hispida]
MYPSRWCTSLGLPFLGHVRILDRLPTWTSWAMIPYQINIKLNPLFFCLQVAIETIYVSVQSVIYSLIIYSMIGFEWKLGKFLLFCYLGLMCFTYFTLYGMMVVALTPNHHIAAIVVSFFIGFWNLFAGFLIPRPVIPIWWRWYYWANPVAWTIYGIIASQVGDRDNLVQIPGFGNVGLKMFLKEGFGYDHDFIPVVVATHVVWVLIFFFVFAYGIKFLNFQRR